MGVPLGFYRVFTNNLHVYKNLPNFDQIWQTTCEYDEYARDAKPMPIIGPKEYCDEILADAEECVLNGCNSEFQTRWFNTVIKPVMMAWEDRKTKRGDGFNWINNIEADDWRIACRQWVERKLSSSISTEPSRMEATGST